jgi:hypothetical protein
MPRRLTIRTSDALFAAIAKASGGNAAAWARVALARAAGLDDSAAEATPPNFTNAKAAKKASRKGVKARKAPKNSQGK